MTEPYFADEHVALYHGDFRELAPLVLDAEPDLVIADPPYGETALEWDRWPDGWPSLAPGRSLWCFGSMRMFLDRGSEFSAGGWKLSQDAIWEKHAGPGFATDRLNRVHEHALHWYRGAWSGVHHEAPRVHTGGRRTAVKRAAMGKEWYGDRGESMDVRDGTTYLRSVIYARSMHSMAINETEKPVGLLEPLIAYGCPVGGLVVDLFAGSCSALVAARATGRRAVGFETTATPAPRSGRNCCGPRGRRSRASPTGAGVSTGAARDPPRDPPARPEDRGGARRGGRKVGGRGGGTGERVSRGGRGGAGRSGGARSSSSPCAAPPTGRRR